MRRLRFVLALVVTLSCRSGTDRAARERLLATAPARRLVGTWDVTLTLDTASSFWKGRAAPPSIHGMLVLAPDHTGPTSSATLDDVTHVGAYDMDLAPFGLATRDADAPAFAVARIAMRQPAPQPVVERDSLWIVLSPERDRFPLRMRGQFLGESAAGVWVADAFGAGGGSGRFFMRRHVPPPETR